MCLSPVDKEFEEIRKSPGGDGSPPVANAEAAANSHALASISPSNPAKNGVWWGTNAPWPLPSLPFLANRLPKLRLIGGVCGLNWLFDTNKSILSRVLSHVN